MGSSVVAWRAVLPIEGRLRQDEFPLEFIVLALSLGMLFAASATGFWVLGQVGWSERAMLMGTAVSIGLVAVYGAASTAVFALATDSVWSLTAIVPAACIGYVLVEVGKFWRESRRSSAGSRAGGPDEPGVGQFI